jgi:hypothetical protein
MLHDIVNSVPRDSQIGLGHNLPPEPIDDAAPEDKRIAELIANANDWAKLHPTIETEEIAVAATDWLNQLNKDWDKIESKRVAQRKPLREQLQAIQDKYVPWLTRIGICRAAIESPHTAYKLAAERQRRAREAEAARVAAEEQRRADQLAEQAKAGGPNVVTNMLAAKEAEESASRARKAAAEVPKSTQIRGALGGRTHSLRTVWRAKVIVQDLLYQHCQNDREVVDLLQRKANEFARAGNAGVPHGSRSRVTLAGCEIYSTQE